MSQTQSSTPTFTFVGTVRRLHASNVPEAPAGDRTAVVEVDRLLTAPPRFADITGEITVLLPEGSDLTAGARRTFWCVGWMLGRGIAVQALEVTEEIEAADAAGAAAADPAARLKEEQLTNRVAGSDLIVRGFVSDVRTVTPIVPRVSEHDPDWHEAVVTVDSVTKGSVPAAADVVVAFPLSRDVIWYNAPKFSVGQRGVWLLHAASDADVPDEHAAALAARPYETFTALDPLDFLPETDEERVATLAEQEDQS